MENLYARSVVEYCERVGDGFFAEPVNLLSNIAFLVSAFFIFKLFKKNKVQSLGFWILYYLVLFIGIGSALWHSVRTPFAHALDAIPIYVFLLVFLYLLLERLTGSIKRAIIGLLLFITLQVAVSIYLPEVFNGSIRHMVSATIFVLVNYWIYKKSNRLDYDFIFALLMYMLGILFRTVDNSMCSVFSTGSHFLWHICTATASYFMIRGLHGYKTE